MYHHLLQRTVAPTVNAAAAAAAAAAACLFSTSSMDPTSTTNRTTSSRFNFVRRNETFCEEAKNSPMTKVTPTNGTNTQEEDIPFNTNDAEKEEELMYQNLFPLRQLWKPNVDYPLWDDNWDGKKPKSSGDEDEDFLKEVFVYRNGVSRHIILIRHGQYDETHEVKPSCYDCPDHFDCSYTLPRHEAQLIITYSLQLLVLGR
jgi:hypothetical protein